MNAIRKSTYPGYGNGNGQQAMTTSQAAPGFFFFRSHIAGLQMEKRYSKTHYSTDLYRLPLLHNNGFSHGFCFVVAGLHSGMILRFVWMMNLFVCYVTPFFDCVKFAGHRFGGTTASHLSICYCHFL